MNRNKFQGWSLRIALFLATIALPTASFAADNVLEQVFDRKGGRRAGEGVSDHRGRRRPGLRGDREEALP